jgi:hypothetical protein
LLALGCEAAPKPGTVECLIDRINLFRAAS